MTETKFINIFNSLNINEKRKLRKWMNLKFVNKTDDIYTFFIFIDTRKIITEETVSKQKIHDYIYKSKPYNDLRIRHLIWLLTEIMEEFIIFLSLEVHPDYKSQLLTNFYLNKDLLLFADKNIELAIKQSEKEVKINADYYHRQYNLNMMHYDINARNDRSKEYRINESIASFTSYTIIEVLKMNSIVNTIQNVMELKSEQPLLNAILEIVPNSKFIELPIIRIYYNLYLITSKDDLNAFEEFMKDIKLHEHLFSYHDQNNLYRSVINFCIKKHNQNNLYFSKHAFELYLYTIENNILVENNEINRFIFTNTITIGIKLKELKKIEHFIADYSHLINTDYKENTLHYNTAKLHYAKNNLDDALKILLTIEFKDTIWNLNAKFIILKILFDQNNTDLLVQHLKAFKKYIKSKTNIGYHRTYFTKVCEAFSTLINIQSNPKKYKDFAFDSTTPDFDWFNKMLKDMQTKKAPK